MHDGLFSVLFGVLKSNFNDATVYGQGFSYQHCASGDTVSSWVVFFLIRAAFISCIVFECRFIICLNVEWPSIVVEEG